MTTDEPPAREPSPGRVFHVWHGVATLLACGLFYVEVFEQRPYPIWTWLVVAFVAEPGSFSRLAIAYAEHIVKWFKRA